MPSWKEEYLTSIKDAELQNPVNMELVQACSQMADRISALEAEKAALESQVSNAGNAGNTNVSAPSRSVDPAASAIPADDAGVTQLRLDLAESLRSKGVTEARLRTAEQELGKLRTKAKDDSRALKNLTAERALLITRLKDKEHEIREKRKLIEACTHQVQDEMITLNLQMSVAEKERDKVKKENKELVDRWMKRMAKEADAMNLANEPLMDK